MCKYTHILLVQFLWRTLSGTVSVNYHVITTHFICSNRKCQQKSRWFSYKNTYRIDKINQIIHRLKKENLKDFIFNFRYADILPISVKTSVQFSCSVVSDSLWSHGLQQARLPCPSPTPGAYSNSYPLHRWWHPTISSSVIPFSSRLQSFPASGSFPTS